MCANSQIFTFFYTASELLIWSRWIKKKKKDTQNNQKMKVGYRVNLNHPTVQININSEFLNFFSSYMQFYTELLIWLRWKDKKEDTQTIRK